MPGRQVTPNMAIASKLAKDNLFIHCVYTDGHGTSIDIFNALPIWQNEICILKIISTSRQAAPSVVFVSFARRTTTTTSKEVLEPPVIPEIVYKRMHLHFFLNFLHFVCHSTANISRQITNEVVTAIFVPTFSGVHSSHFETPRT